MYSGQYIFARVFMTFPRAFIAVAAGVACMFHAATAAAQDDFINYETPHVHPLDLSPDGMVLAACNTADNRVELFDVSGEKPVPLRSVPVGYDPCSVRFRSNGELWVVNHISDSVSIVDVASGTVIHTLATRDEPCDVVFAGTPERAFVSCSQVNTIQVFNLANLSASPANVAIDAEDPRALAVSADGSRVYAAVFESGNRTTVLMGSADNSGRITFPPNVVANNGTPHGGQNPPFNGDGAFLPAKAQNGVPPRVSLIVKQDDQGRWLDDANGDWTRWITGDLAHTSGRPQGWTLLDHDVAVINADNLSVGYIDGLMNLNMAIAVNPATGEVTTVGTDAINELRFEPNVNGIFVRVMLGTGDPESLAVNGIADLNAHLNYQQHTIPQPERDKSIGDPRGIVWRADGQRGYVTGMGSNNIVTITPNGARAGAAPTIEVGEGPTGIVLDESRARLYVLNRFDATVSMVDVEAETVVETVAYFDPTPDVIKAGRPFLYDTHRTSGLGHVSCGACHIDSRMDRLAWDLGDPSGAVKGLNGLNLGANVPQLNTGFRSFHPMKGPMTTQTLQDIIGMEPFHWRGDRLGIEEFNGAFAGLLGDDTVLTDEEMKAFKDYLATIHFPPNPYRNRDNTLPASMPLPGHYTPGRFSPAGQPLPNGNAQAGLALYRNTKRLIDSGVLACVTCHTLPTGTGTDTFFDQLGPAGLRFTDLPPDPVTGNRHTMLVSIDGSTNVTLKVPQLRNLYDKVGMDLTHTTSRAGFGFSPDGAIDSIERFVAEEVFDVASDQEVANLTAFLLCFSGSGLPEGRYEVLRLEPPGRPGKDSHAAVGWQFTLKNPNDNYAALQSVLTYDTNSSRIEMVAHVLRDGVMRGFLRVSSLNWQPDREGDTISFTALRQYASPETPITFTVVPQGTGRRLALDRDRDGYYNFDELQDCTDPADPDSFGKNQCPDDGIHSADRQGDNKIDLGELLRVVQFYNAGAIHCEGSEDGFAPVGADAPKDTSCRRHDADYAEPAWSITLTELLRVIQFFNTGGYVPCDSEDGYCPVS
jgi:YVTN family beta-propeller protein